MSINERIKEVRKARGLNQKEFSDKIGLTQSAVSRMESADVAIIDQNVRLICQTFHINEKWLRTGQGKMDEVKVEAPIEALVKQYRLDNSQRALVEAFLSLTDEQRSAVVDAACAIADKVKTARHDALQAKLDKRDRAHAKLDEALDAEEKDAAASSSSGSASAKSSTEKRA